MKLRSNGVTFDAIKFRNGDGTVKAGTRLDVVYSVDENHYAGNVYYQLQLKDFRNTSESESPRVPTGRGIGKESLGG